MYGQRGDVSDVSGVVREGGSWKCKEFVLFLREADEGVNVRRWERGISRLFLGSGRGCPHSRDY